jgi:hypothetical protein
LAANFSTPAKTKPSDRKDCQPKGGRFWYAFHGDSLPAGPVGNFDWAKSSAERGECEGEFLTGNEWNVKAPRLIIDKVVDLE